jgi:hypothetical protein
MQAVWRYTEALTGLIKAGEADPEHLDAHWNECLTRLTLGDFCEGWPLHEARWQKTKAVGSPTPPSVDTLALQRLLALVRPPNR